MAPPEKKRKLSNGDVATKDAFTPDAKAQDLAAKDRKTLFIRSLPTTSTSESLTDLFSESYPVKHAIAVLDPATKQCRGYGFVTLADAKDARRAKDEFDGHTLEGKKLRVELAEPRSRDAEGVQTQSKVKVKDLKKVQEVPQPSRLIVRNLPWTIKNAEQLSKLFLSYGKIKTAYIPKNRSGLMAGFGFVVLRGRKNAEKALEGINGKLIDGRTLAVDWAVEKEVYEGLLKQETTPADTSEGAVADPASDVDEDGVEVMENGDDDMDSEQSEGMSDELGSEAEMQDFEVEDVGDEEAEEFTHGKMEDRSSTVFVRNLPFNCTDEDLENHFTVFGATRYARIVLDFATERSKGTGFVCFYEKSDADACLRGAPKTSVLSTAQDAKDASAKVKPGSILQNDRADASGRYSIDGRVLQISRAVDRSEADRLTQDGAAHRRKRNEDRRRVYLLSEGTISSKSELWEKLSPTERNMREASAKQRKQLIESNPSLHVSLTRLSIRNIPRSIDSKALKGLARDAVVGFAKDVRAGTRERLSKEELLRSGEDMQAAEQTRKKAGKGIVRQAKVVFEGAGGGKVEESTGAGKSRGYGFVEYYTHRNALMGLRWLNGYSVDYQVKDTQSSKIARDREQFQDRKKRLIVEFAIENASVTMRRKERESKARERSDAVSKGLISAGQPTDGDANTNPGKAHSLKRKRAPDQGRHGKHSKMQKPANGNRKSSQSKAQAATEVAPKKLIDEKLAQRNRIIGRKRAVRARKGAK